MTDLPDLFLCLADFLASVRWVIIIRSLQHQKVAPAAAAAAAYITRCAVDSCRAVRPPLLRV